ncbi:MAG: glycosyltransferase [Actinobacteria bacterium]|nr:glycosyltransferase [Actinomycetota bacterium]
MTTILWYNSVVAVMLFVILLNFIKNLGELRLLSSYKLAPDLKRPFVSVLVPARNEERNIARCINSLIAQDYGNFEIIVLNDNSTDRTEEILSELAKTDSRIRILKGRPLPHGWVGKNFACHQLYKAAKGEYLFYADADTWHHKSSLSNSIAAVLESKSDLITLLPTEIVESISERMIVPFMNFAVMCFFPLKKIYGSKNPLFSFSVGQYMLFRRSAYDAIGGHAAIPGEIVEDIVMGKRIKRFGFRQLLLDGKGMVYCRMYQSLKEVWRGFSKSLFAAFKFKLPPLIFVIVTVDALFFAPFFFLTYMLIKGNFMSLNLFLLIAQVLLIFTIKALMSYRFNYSYLDVFMHPISIFHINMIAIYSIFLHVKGIGVVWKDRRYRSEKSEELITENLLGEELLEDEQLVKSDEGVFDAEEIIYFPSGQGNKSF